MTLPAFKEILLILLILNIFSCQEKKENRGAAIETEKIVSEETTLIVLGNVQDAGSPHIGCKKSCCKALFIDPDKNRKVVSLGVVDPVNQKKFLFDATPDMTEQLKILKNYLPKNTSETPDGIFLTHAHIGHYTGLMYFGREALGAKEIPVYTMPGMSSFLKENGPWNQLISLGNIKLQSLKDRESITLTSTISIVPFLVPHRDEYSETVGFKIIGPKKTALFIPDIDKWYKWETDIREEIKKVDYAFLDAGFYSEKEINNRDISEIPHPTVLESMALFDDLTEVERDKVWFIHMNHTNPMLNPDSEESKAVLSKGYHIARFEDRFAL